MYIFFDYPDLSKERCHIYVIYHIYITQLYILQTENLKQSVFALFGSHTQGTDIKFRRDEVPGEVRRRGHLEQGGDPTWVKITFGEFYGMWQTLMYVYVYIYVNMNLEIHRSMYMYMYTLRMQKRPLGRL